MENSSTQSVVAVPVGICIDVTVERSKALRGGGRVNSDIRLNQGSISCHNNGCVWLLLGGLFFSPRLQYSATYHADWLYRRRLGIG